MTGDHQWRRGLFLVLIGMAAVTMLVVSQPSGDGRSLRYEAEQAGRGVALQGQTGEPQALDAVLLATRSVLVEFDGGVERTKRDAFDRLTEAATAHVEMQRTAAEIAQQKAAEQSAAEQRAAEELAIAERAAESSSTAAPSSATEASSSASPTTGTATSNVSSPTTTGVTTTGTPKSGTLLPIVPPPPAETVVATTARPTTTPAPTTTTTSPPPIASKTPIDAGGSLTGLRGGPDRPALAVKIDNSAAARPQTGINQADVVVEELVEFGLTRLIAIFHSSDPSTVGPVRSARTSDIHLLTNLNKPLLSYSGANDGVLKQLKASDLRLAGAPNLASGYSRSSARKAPHNLFASPAQLRSKIGGGGNAPAMFTYRPTGSAAINGARPVSGVSIKFGTDTVAYTWNGVGWIRTISGRPHTDSTGKVVAPENVVVRFMDYRQSTIDARSPEAIAVGSGTVWVFTDGKRIEGTWSQASATAPTIYTDRSGDPILLTPGRTWVALPRPGTGSVF